MHRVLNTYDQLDAFTLILTLFGRLLGTTVERAPKVLPYHLLPAGFPHPNINPIRQFIGFWKANLKPYLITLILTLFGSVSGTGRRTSSPTSSPTTSWMPSPSTAVGSTRGKKKYSLYRKKTIQWHVLKNSWPQDPGSKVGIRNKATISKASEVERN